MGPPETVEFQGVLLNLNGAVYAGVSAGVEMP